MLIALTLLLIGGLFYLYKSNSNLKTETQTLDQLLRETLLAHERELADHKESVQELAVIRAKLESIQSISLTPENAVPKHVHTEKIIEMSQELVSLQTQLSDMTRQFEESRGKQISERTRLGQVSENFAAFTDQFPYERKHVKALFQPVDLIYFGDDELVLIDVKSGDSTLSTKQRKIRDNVRNGNVKFRVMRINQDGISWED